ncbi:hypothetical protein NECAME_03799 [Necator americanus]|uniref:Uncharacterized protein n=1 Tax=Necator americanus TaxID=51031 RepID=W2T366_NECAM|nr:hypothetical protein NECAME_03799 [Necator americanus]ETN75417.1 hypothetical protein NECAME_03799 [Necator americanus]
MLHISLPSVQNSLKAISERLFLLLSEYSVLGSAANKESVLALNQLLCKVSLIVYFRFSLIPVNF